MTSHLVTRRAVLLGGAALLGLHFALAAFSQAPATPLKVRHFDEVKGYLNPYFAQNWMLFAPDPLADDRGVLARAQCRDGSVTDYHDVTTTYVREAQESRFFPSRMSRLVSAPMQSINATDPLLDRLREKHEDDIAKDRKDRKDGGGEVRLMPEEQKAQDNAVRFLSRYSLTQMPDACGGDPQRIQVRMYVRELPPWSKRNAPAKAGEDTVQVQDFDWLKADELR
ncbi:MULTISPECIES: DUF5819 family protein [Streptomyces]|uniref:DUF5819 family protein n=1 Tax=Streptomyces TaxID=1883 RepID=UPI001266ACAA|nr:MULTISPECIES: DUF5819 family protein [Streptomyces]MBB4159930.1 hypothetical protein [Streptomyces cinereoruber]MBY8817710.1 DUF5819 family protein [Streptomyces cinereoruber]NIH60638.1 hypothetical protein [Streptomyces cinereoruber]